MTGASPSLYQRICRMSPLDDAVIAPWRRKAITLFFAAQTAECHVSLSLMRAMFYPRGASTPWVSRTVTPIPRAVPEP